MNTTLHATGLDIARRVSGVLLAISMLAMAADVYAPSGARQLPIDDAVQSGVDPQPPRVGLD
jgi:hypothetical protein